MKKNRVSMFAAVIAGSLLSLAMAAPLMAQEEAAFNVKETVAIPNAVLTPGTYVFKKLDSSHLVEVHTIDGKAVGIFLTMPSAIADDPSVAGLKLKDHRLASIHFAEDDAEMQFLYPAAKQAASRKSVLPIGFACVGSL